MVLGFAVFLRFMKVFVYKEGKYYGNYQNNDYLINDDGISYFAEIADLDREEYIKHVLGDQNLWGADLNLLNGFVDAVIAQYELIESAGIAVALSDLTSAKLDVN